MDNKKKVVGRTFALVLTAVAVAVSFILSMFVAIGENSKNVSEELDSNIAKTVNVMENYSYGYSANLFKFTDGIYSKANTLALAYQSGADGETLQKFARNQGVDKVYVTDENGDIVAAQPDGKKGGNIKDDENTKQFLKVLKGVSFKNISDAQPVEGTDGEYYLYAAVNRTDAPGIVIIGLTADNYGELQGYNLAERFGNNTAVYEGGKLKSALFDDYDFEFTEEDLAKESFKKTFVSKKNDSKTEFICKTQATDELIVVAAAEKKSAFFSLFIILAADIVLLLAVTTVFVLGDKFSEFCKRFFDVKFWKFIMVGILNTVVGTGLQFLFFNLCGWGEWISSIIGYILGSVLSYFLNKYFTFKNKEKGWKPVAKFALNIAICYGLAYGIAIPLTKWLCVANSLTMFGWTVDKFAGNSVYDCRLLPVCRFQLYRSKIFRF